MWWLISTVDILAHEEFSNGGSSGDVVAYLRRTGCLLVDILAHDE